MKNNNKNKESDFFVHFFNHFQKFGASLWGEGRPPPVRPPLLGHVVQAILRTSFNSVSGKVVFEIKYSLSEAERMLIEQFFQTYSVY